MVGQEGTVAGGGLIARIRTVEYKWIVALIFVFGLFMDLLDTTIVNVALPTFAREFHTSNSNLEWVVTAYLLSLAVWIPASGWLGDRFGTKRIFMLALVLFTIGSLLCGEAQSLRQLIFFRVLQGVGGGMLTPVGTAMLYRAFPPYSEPRHRPFSSSRSPLRPQLDRCWEVSWSTVPVGAGFFGSTSRLVFWPSSLPGDS